MSRPASRLLAMSAAPRCLLLPANGAARRRPFSHTSPRRADDKPPPPPSTAPSPHAFRGAPRTETDDPTASNIPAAAADAAAAMQGTKTTPPSPSPSPTPETPAPAPGGSFIAPRKDGPPPVPNSPGLSSFAASSTPPPHQPRPLERLSASLSSATQQRATTAEDTIARALNQPTPTDKQAAAAAKMTAGESALASLSASGKKTGGKGKGAAGPDGEVREDYDRLDEPFHFHIYGHRHNTHITVTKPDRNAIISMSTGQLGFRKARRHSYDAAYQLTAYVVDKLYQGNWHNAITKMEVACRGFGPGREAAVKVLLGSEGRFLRDSIVKVSDATRIKFGGTRSPKPRRLG